MNKVELVAKVVANLKAKGAEVTLTGATPIVSEVFDVLKDRMYQEETVNIAGFGKFLTKKREARIGRNPQTGTAVEIGAKNVPCFKPSKELKEYVQD